MRKGRESYISREGSMCAVPREGSIHELSRGEGSIHKVLREENICDVSREGVYMRYREKKGV